MNRTLRTIVGVFTGSMMFLLTACTPAPAESTATRRIVSLDYCADQFVLKFADTDQIAALSPDAKASFSYMRETAKGFPTVRPRPEDVLLLKPDIVVRSYGGGPLAASFFKRAGIDVVQIGFAGNLNDVQTIVADTADALGAPEKGKEVIADMDRRLKAIPSRETAETVLYITSKGASAGRNTLIDDLIAHAGFTNFKQRSGWGSIPLEQLAYEKPDIIATGFFETTDLITDQWTPARHPVAQNIVARTSRIDLPGALTACGGWFVVDVVEKLASYPQTGAH